MSRGRVLVIGQSGQVARALAELGAGREMLCLGRDALDLADLEAIGPAVSSALAGADGAAGGAAGGAAVINAAAYTAVDQAEAEPELAERINGAAVGRIAAAAAAAGAPLVHLSTDYVFDGTGSRAYGHSDPVSPSNAYGASKLAGEAAALAAQPETAVIRTSWVYAPWGKNFVATMLRLAGRDRLTVVDDQIGAPSSALEIAAACLTVADGMQSAPGPERRGVFHFTGAGEASWADFAEAVFAGALARGMIDRAPEILRIPTSDYPTPARRPANSRLDCSRIAESFGIRTRPWQESLDAVLDRLAAG